MKSGFVFLLFVAFSAQAFNRDIQKEKIIEDQLKEIDSSLLNNFKSATIAMDGNNLVLADSLYSIVYESATEFDPLLRRLGSIKVQLGQTEEGIKLCEKAVGINKSAYNIISLAGCYLSAGKESKNYEQNLQKGLSLMKEAENMPHGDELEFPSLIGQIALELNDVRNLEIQPINLSINTLTH